MLLSLDVAFSHLGWSVFNRGEPIAVGVISPADDNKKKTLVSDERADKCAHAVIELMKVIAAYPVRGVIGELPSGSKNAAAANMLGISSGMIVTFCLLKDLPAEWVSQNDVKMAVTGKLSATKEEIMDKVAAFYGWEKKEKVIQVNEGKRAGKVSMRADYHVLGEKYPKVSFEHIADSIGVYWASKHRNLVRLFG